MKNLIIILFVAVFTQAGFGQSIQKREAFIFEMHNNDSTSHDTTLFLIELFNSNGKRYHSIKFNSKGDTIQERIWQGDSIRFIYFAGLSNARSPIESHYDKYGEVTTIIHSEDTTHYENFYTDSILSKRICINERRYVKEFLYNENKKITSTIEYEQQLYTVEGFSIAKDTVITKWEYNDRGGILKYIEEDLTVLNYIKYEYKENPKEVHKVLVYKDSNDEYERTVTIYDENDNLVQEHLYIDKKLKSKIFFKNYYFKD